MKLTVLFFAAGLLVASCNPAGTPNELPVYTISTADEAQPLPLSDIMEIGQIIALETREDNFFKNHTPVFPTGEYIIVEDYEKALHQYSREGKFIRFLADRGKGPNEYDAFMAFGFDRNRNVFYYSDIQDGPFVSSIDLRTGTHLENVPLPVEVVSSTGGVPYLSSLIVTENGALACVPARMPGMRYSLFLVDAKGNFLEGTSYSPETALSAFQAREVDGQIHLMKRFWKASRDTVFSIQQEIKEPAFIVEIEEDVANAVGDIRAEGLKTLIVLLIYSQPGNRSTGELFYVNKSTHESFKVSKFRVNELGGIETQVPDIMSGGELAIAIDAFEFKTQAEEILKGDVAPDIRTRLEGLLSQVTENSNPIVIVGKLK